MLANPTFKRARYLSIAIESMVALVYPILELPILDDRCTDTAAQVVQTLRRDRVQSR